MHIQHSSPYGALNTIEILGAEAAGMYTLRERIGIGTFADVYQAKHEVTQELVAIKVLRAPFSRDTLARFKKEIRILQESQHPNIVDLIEDHSSGEVPFCVMEYCSEDSLMALMNQQKGGLSLAMVDFIFPQIVQGVDALHQQGIIHRDLKPSNVLLTKTPQGLLPKISDLGIAKKRTKDLTQKRDLTQIDGGRTMAGTSLGTFGYLAPELLGYANEADQRTDIFSLGAILFEMIACINPFDGPDRDPRVLEDNNAACRYVLSPQQIPLRYHDVLDRCLQRDPSERFNTCAELLQAFYTPVPIQPIPDTRMGYVQTALLGGFAGLVFSSALMWLLFPTISPSPSGASPSPTQQSPKLNAAQASPIQLEPLPSRPAPTQAAQPPSRPPQSAPSRIYRRRRKRIAKRRNAPRVLPIFQVQPTRSPSKSSGDPYQENSSIAKDAKDAFGQKPKADSVFQDSEGLKKDTEDAFSQAKRRVPPPRRR
ncbi:MAG: serine/threonine protein kinase [Myxococcales bacterium]|nr:serine/threonine protein kinase [Myxococcales bacterium]